MLELVQKIGGLPNKHGPTYGLYRFGHKVTLLFITSVRGNARQHVGGRILTSFT